MPQASENPMRFESDSDALEFLEEQGIKCDKDFYIRVAIDTKLTNQQFDAIDYLCNEWDYGFEWI